MRDARQMMLAQLIGLMLEESGIGWLSPVDWQAHTWHRYCILKVSFQTHAVPPHVPESPANACITRSVSNAQSDRKRTVSYRTRVAGLIPSERLLIRQDRYWHAGHAAMQELRVIQ